MNCKKIIKKFSVVLVCVFVLCLASFVNNKMKLNKEKDLLQTIGNPVEVHGKKLNVFSRGSGAQTFVFMAGGGTCSPVLDFKSLYSLLASDYRVVVVEKLGYGFSDDGDSVRDIDTILEETREALIESKIDGPYVLCPHSMSGIEALYWVQKYPEEIKAIIGLDMAFPEYYEKMKINLPMIKFLRVMINLGVARFAPGLADGEAVKNGTLTDYEKKVYRAVFYNRTLTDAMLSEVKMIKKNAKKVTEKSIPEIPMLLFVSNGKGGTGFDKDSWRTVPNQFAKDRKNVDVIELDCPHYVHDFEYQKINNDIRIFMNKNAKVADSIPREYRASVKDGGKIEHIIYKTKNYYGDESIIEKKANVYLPMGYTPEKKYSVLYLMHGIGGNENEWGMTDENSVIKRLMDNLTVKEEIEPFIIVTPNGKAGYKVDSKKSDYNAFYKFGLELRNELIPYIDEHYSTFKDRNHRAMAGLSMGGMQTINIGICECIDLFSYYGAFSAAPSSYAAFKVATVIDANPQYPINFFYNICGKEDRIAYSSHFDAARLLPKITENLKNEENFIWQERTGSHDFGIWYLGFYNFTKIFGGTN